MSRLAKIAALAILAPVFAGCSSQTESLNSMIGLDKDVPDERLVRTHQTLATPPDLQLRPPPAETKETGTRNPLSQNANTAVRSSSSPPNNTYAPAEPAYTPPDANNIPAANAPPVNTQVATAPVPSNDVYAKYGISRTNPDGTEKSQEQLIEALRAKQKQMEQSKNANYGTVFNIGNLFD